jgi:hypothetical protein
LRLFGGKDYDISNAIGVAIGHDHALVLLSTGNVLAINDAWYGKDSVLKSLIYNIIDYDANAISSPDTQFQVLKLACGMNRSALISTTGQLYAWGEKNHSNVLNWRLNDGERDSLGLQPINNRRFPKLTLRNSFSPDLPLNYKGVGNEFVYVVYQSESRVESVLRDRDNWLLKVGRTNNLRRRVSQLSESGPNSLVIGIAFKTYNSRGLEKYIHQSLHNQKKACDIPGRKEWFFSNLAEIEDLRGQFELKSLLVA